ncbi:MAG: transcriptional regulator, LuxR family [Myxococcales bacterium]|nr:transcriptional regulator, LuxR family [Myxococcales bacterium]
MIGLLGDLHDLAHTPADAIAELGKGLLRNIGGDAIGIGEVPDFSPGVSAPLVNAIAIGLKTARELEVAIGRPMTQSIDCDPAMVPLRRLTARARGRATTARQSDLISAATVRRSSYLDELTRITGIQDVMYSAIPVGSNARVVSVALWRERARSFRLRDREAMNTFHRAAGSLYPRLVARVGEVVHVVHDLRPSLRKTLDALLAGLTEKEIAHRRQLSTHTVHEYVKLLYTRLGVSSRAELLALFVKAP